jgi:hypothetical protein
MHDHRVLAVIADGVARTIVTVDNWPSGLRVDTERRSVVVVDDGPSAAL